MPLSSSTAQQDRLDRFEHDRGVERDALVLEIVKIVFQLLFRVLDRRAVWILEGGQEGGQRLRYITYGAKYPDLKESQRPLRLRRGKRYEVFVYTSTGAKSVDVFAFRVDENGNVRQVPWLVF